MPIILPLLKIEEMMCVESFASLDKQIDTMDSNTFSL